jgi:hypothetical protein
MELGGSVLGLASLNQSAELHALYRDYLSAAEGAEDIYALYLTNGKRMPRTARSRADYGRLEAPS